MPAYEILKRLEETGELKILCRAGFFQPTVFRNLEIYYYIDAQMQTGIKKTAAVKDAEIKFNLCYKTIFLILRSFK